MERRRCPWRTSLWRPSSVSCRHDWRAKPQPWRRNRLRCSRASRWSGSWREDLVCAGLKFVIQCNSLRDRQRGALSFSIAVFSRLRSSRLAARVKYRVRWPTTAALVQGDYASLPSRTFCPASDSAACKCFCKAGAAQNRQLIVCVCAKAKSNRGRDATRN
jgi:hypothetical protein